MDERTAELLEVLLQTEDGTEDGPPTPAARELAGELLELWREGLRCPRLELPVGDGDRAHGYCPDGKRCRCRPLVTGSSSPW